MPFTPFNDRRGPIMQVRAVSTVALSAGAQTIDGVACVVGDVVLEAVPGANVANGIKVIRAATLERPKYANSATHYRNGKLVQVAEGTTYGGSVWKLVTAAVTPGTTAHAWEQTSMVASDSGASSGALSVSGMSYMGTRTIAQIDALTPATGWAVVAGDAGTPSAGASDALVQYDVAEYDGTQWQKTIDAGAAGVAAGTKLVCAATGETLYAPLTDSTDNTKIATFGGSGATPGLRSPDLGEAVRVTDSDSVLVGYERWWNGTAWVNQLPEEQLRGAAAVLSADLAVNSQKITGLANGSASSDAAAFGQIGAATLTLQDLGSAPVNSIDLSTNPTATDTITIGADVYEFQAAAADLASDTNIAIEIKGSAALTLVETLAAINGTAANPHATIFQTDSTTPAVGIGTESFLAIDGGSQVLLLVPADAIGGSVVYGAGPNKATSDTLTAVVAWASANMNLIGGHAAAARNTSTEVLTITAAHITATAVRFLMPFTPTAVLAQLRDSSGAAVAISTDTVTISGDYIIVSTGTDFTNTDVLTLTAWE